MSGTSACCCVLGAHRPRRHSAAASSSCQDAVSLSRSDASLFQETTPRLLAGVGPHPPASVAFAGQASCADAPRALQVGTFVPSARWRPCRASCPADRWLLPATCCALSWPPLLLPALSCANGSRPKRLSSSGTQVGCSGAQCLRSGSRTFYMLLTLSYMDNPLGDCLHNRTQARALVLVAELWPCSLHT